jgi:hypothetical protein
MSVKDTNNTDNLLKRLNELYSKKITVGVHGDVGDDIFDRATWNEFGTHDAKGKELIPERSFIRAGYDKNKAKIKRDTEKLTQKVIAMELKPQTAAKLLGDVTKGYIQEYAINLKVPANKYSTILKKGSSNPLVDTGQMIGSIDYKIEG